MGPIALHRLAPAPGRRLLVVGGGGGIGIPGSGGGRRSIIDERWAICSS